MVCDRKEARAEQQCSRQGGTLRPLGQSSTLAGGGKMAILDIIDFSDVGAGGRC